MDVKKMPENKYYCICKVCGLEMIITAKDETEAQWLWGQTHAPQCEEVRKFALQGMKELNARLVDKFLDMRKQN
jgi:ssDNA-binding Zn-finger/Zn-ribbon topoisomerase 1